MTSSQTIKIIIDSHNITDNLAEERSNDVSNKIKMEKKSNMYHQQASIFTRTQLRVKNHFKNRKDATKKTKQHRN